MKQQPVVSIIIPAYFSFNTIKYSLQSLKEQTYNDAEIIVVNSSPEQKTASVVCTDFPEVNFIQSDKRLLPHAARNKGVAVAKGHLLVFTDPDCIAEKDWLQKLVDATKKGESIVAGGMGLVRSNWRETGIHLQKFYWCLDGSPVKYLPGMATANACYTKEVWDKIGPFDPNIFSGDIILSWKALANNYRIKFEPGAVIKHHHETSIRNFLKERFSRGKEFATLRSAYYRWSTWRSFVYLVATPLNLLGLLFKSGRLSILSGYGRGFFLTFPLQIIGHAAWLSGEAMAYKKNLFKIRGSLLSAPTL